ncbi:hypothetical protein R5R35_004844 [Gryllus longicercus]|uniref:Uncharacterized protein n=1 Tax=Gryllus longicercus TaxID=2509291 RepID=A0AAN9Z4F4_9ORTH
MRTWRRSQAPPQERGSLGKAIVRGVRNLPSSVPVVGSILGGVMDFVFAPSGYASAVTVDGTSAKKTFANVRWDGLTAAFVIRPIDLLLGSKLGVMTKREENPSNPYLKYTYASNYSAGRVVHHLYGHVATTRPYRNAKFLTDVHGDSVC